MMKTGVKIVFGIKIHQYFNENKKKHEDISLLIEEISDNLNNNALILLKTALISMDNLYYVLDLFDRVLENSSMKQV